MALKLLQKVGSFLAFAMVEMQFEFYSFIAAIYLLGVLTGVYICGWYNLCARLNSNIQIPLRIPRVFDDGMPGSFPTALPSEHQAPLAPNAHPSPPLIATEVLHPDTEGFALIQRNVMRVKRELSLQERVSPLRNEQIRLQTELRTYLRPSSPADAGARLGDILTGTTRKNGCVTSMQSGFDKDAIDKLGDRWIDALCRLPEDFETWATHVFLDWGRHTLPDIIADVLDGEAEFIFDQEFADFATELDEYWLPVRIAKLDAALVQLQMPPSRVPHRLVEPSAARHGPSRDGAQYEVGLLFDGQVEWHQALRQVEWQDMPSDPLVPLVEGVRKEYPTGLSQGFSLAIARQLIRNFRVGSTRVCERPAHELFTWIQDVARTSAKVREGSLVQIGNIVVRKDNMAMTQQPPNLARSRYNAAFQSSIFEPPAEQMQSTFVPAGKRRDQTTAEIFGSYDEKDLRAMPKTFVPKEDNMSARQRKYHFLCSSEEVWHVIMAVGMVMIADGHNQSSSWLL
eukprot:s4288_g4.t1